MASITPASKPKRNPNFWQDTLRGYLFILPVVLGLIIWTFGPMVASAYYSFTSYNIVDAPEWVGFQNYNDLFTNDRRFVTFKSEPCEILFVQLPRCFEMGGSLGVTWNFAWKFIIAGQSISLLLAVLLTQKVHGQAFFRTMFYMPMVVPFVASSLLWRYLFNREFGPINAVFQWFGFEPINWLGSPDWALNSLVIMSIWGGAVSTIIYVAGLQNIPSELQEAAEIDGAGPIQRFFRITIPLLTPTIFFNVVTNVIGAFQFFVPAFIMTEGGPVGSTYFYNLNLYDKAFKWLQMGYASAMAWVMFGIIIVLTAMVFRSSPLWVYYEGEVRK